MYTFLAEMRMKTIGYVSSLQRLIKQIELEDQKEKGVEDYKEIN